MAIVLIIDCKGGRIEAWRPVSRLKPYLGEKMTPPTR